MVAACSDGGRAGGDLGATTTIGGRLGRRTARQAGYFPLRVGAIIRRPAASRSLWQAASAAAKRKTCSATWQQLEPVVMRDPWRP
ncbi:hypothetical protein ACU4GD_21105 [Cupriavidus basilensis]